MESKRTKLTRREFLGTGLAVSTALQFGRPGRVLGDSSPAPACTLAAEQEVGPFYVADELLRSNITEGKPGLPLALRLVILDSRTCEPLPNAAIDLWHCDALGVYSGFTKMSLGGPGGPGSPPPDFGHHPPGGHRPPAGPPRAMTPTDHETFLRGIQLTDATGAVTFHTIVPGYYRGRTNHIHFKVRVDGSASGKTYAEGHTSHVGQVFFPEDLISDLMKREPYRQHTIHRVTQTEDGIFRGQQGALFVAGLHPVLGDKENGWEAQLAVGVDPTATPAPVAGGGGLGGPPPFEHRD